ncbi:MAG: DUF1343 domain-containing protein [Planctomycetota bacterium]|nr:DUF1343 domain-containing protein [Planctomycetota bacterium]
MTGGPNVHWLLAVPLWITASLTAQDVVTVQNGIDVLQSSDFAALAGRKVGLISNHTGLNLSGQSTAVLLHRAKSVDLRILFSPEHGFAGKLDQSKVDHAIHKPTGLRIHSLYNKDRKPDAASLRGLDTLVFDIQDIGCRFYTYISTMGEAMRTAAAHKLRFVVLDRPNPINGVDVGGVMRDPGEHLDSFVAWHKIPVRHGMTVGELAQMFRVERKMSCDLQVIRMKAWQRRFFFDATGQTWVNPSPNMRNLTQALLYPGVGLLETTNLSVGRGTDTPFEILGAPWMNGPDLARAVNGARLPGLRCVPIRFTPTSSKYSAKQCSGIRLCITSRAAFDPVTLGIQLAFELRRLHPEAWKHQNYNRLLVNRRVFDLVARGAKPKMVKQMIQLQLRDFLRRRARFLLYE